MLSVKEVGERRTHLVFFNRKDPDTHETETVRVELRFIALKLVSKEGGSHSGMDFTWVLEDYLDAPRPEISADAQKALMLDFINRHPGFKKLPKEEQATLMAKDQFLNCLFAKYGYAMTCHKAQGSEWPNVVVDASPINSADNESYFRWLYTAITRAKEKLFIVHAPTLTGFILKPIKCDTAPNELKLDASQNREAHESKASRASFCDGCANGDKYSIIHNIVENALQGSGLAIEDLVKHSEYHYTCTVSSSDRIHGARISIFWSAKKQGISSVLAQPENEFSKGVADRISRKIKTPSFSNILSSSSKPEEFILDLHRRLVDAGKKTGVEFSDPKCSSYKIDFECRTIEGSALLIVYYDAKHSFTKVDVQKASPDAEQRIHQTLGLLRSSS